MMPTQPAVRPRSGALPESTATIDMPRNEKASNSGEPRNNMTGRRIGIETAIRKAPNTPPMSEDMYAALSARPASPFLAIGKPSSTVAAEAAPPGTPNSTAGIGSPVAVVDPSPSSSANAVYGSMLKVNGSSIAVPARPPIPGTIPSTRPMTHPAARYIRRTGSIKITKALPAAVAMKAISAVTASISQSSPVSHQRTPHTNAPSLVSASEFNHAPPQQASSGKQANAVLRSVAATNLLQPGPLNGNHEREL